jgi:hypothetical protein
VRYAQEPPDTDGVDLHSESAFASAEAHEAALSPGRRRYSSLAPSAESPFEVPLGLRVVMGALRVLMLPVMALGALFRAFWALRRWLGWAPVAAPVHVRRGPGHPPPCRREADWLVNDVHGCRVRVPPGVDEIDATKAWVKGGLWSVFALRLDDETVVTCDAHSLDDMRAISPHGRLVEDERYHVGGLKARRRVLEIRSPQVLMQREVHVIQMPRALYVWELPDIRDAARRARFRALVESFEPIVPGGA